jgi:uncharacterized membrane protein YdjX (TVP38/TMEM64 family)
MEIGVLAGWLRGYGHLTFASGAGLGALFVLAAFLPFPRTLLLILSGAVFGLEALAVVVPCSALGSSLAFFLARMLFRGRVAEFVYGNRGLSRVASAVDAAGWQVVAIMRLGVPIPSAFQNYLFAVTKIGSIPFILCTFLFSIPQMALFVYLGTSSRAALSMDNNPAIDQISWAFGSLMTLLLIVLIGRQSNIRLQALTARAQRSSR